MRILLIEPSGAGGIAHYTYALANALGELGLECDILTGKRWGNWPLPSTVSVFPLFRGGRTNPLTLLTFLWRHRTRWVLIHWQSTTHPEMLLWLMRLVPLKSLPWIFTVHNVVPHEVSAKAVACYRAIYARMQGLIFHTEHSQRDFSTRFPGIQAQWACIPHGEYGFLGGNSAAALSNTNHSILFFGNIRRYKGLDLLLRAFATVREEVSDCELTIAGQPLEDFSPYQRLINELQLENHIQLRLHYIADSEIPSLFASAGVVVLPYRRIDQSGVLLLAMACGKAVIATRVGGLEEVIKDQETGVLVPPDDVTSLTTAILDLLHHPQKRFHLGEKARHEVVTRFSWPHIAELTLTFYKRVIG